MIEVPLVERQQGDNVRIYPHEDGETITTWIYREREDGKMLGFELVGKLVDFPDDLLSIEDFERCGINPINGVALKGG